MRKLLENERKLLNAFNSNTQKRPQIFKELTGLDYTPENMEKFIKGQIKLPSEIALDKYKEGQEMVVDITSDIVSGAAAFGTATACIAGGIAAAPFTAGVSLGAVAAGIGIGAGVGSGTKVAIKAADAYSGGREYTLEEAGKDALIGGVSGGLATVTLGAGGTVANATSKVAPKFIANTARYSVEGGMFGAADGATRATVEGESLENIAVAAVEGAFGGALAGNVMGHGTSAVGKGFSKIKDFEYPWVTKKINNLIDYMEGNKYNPVKLNEKDKDALRYLVNQTNKQNIKADIADYQWENIIKLLKNSGEYSKEDCDAILSLIKKTDDDAIIRMFEYVQFQDDAPYLKPKEVMNLVKILKDLKPEQITALLGGKTNSLGGNLVYFNNIDSWKGNMLDLFTKIIPEADKMQPKTLKYLKSILSLSESGGMDGIDAQEQKIYLEVLKNLKKEEIEIFEKNGININKIIRDLDPVTTGFEVKVSKEVQNKFIKSVIANNNPTAESTLKSSSFKNYLSELERSGAPIPLKYPRQDFIKDLQELLNKLPEGERDKVLKHLNIDLKNGDFDGFIKLEDFNYNEFSNESQSVLKQIKSKAEDFVLKNETRVPDNDVKKILDDLIQGFPEFTSIIGKTDAGYANTVEVHTLQTLSEVLSHPQYAQLNDFEKTMLKFSVILQDIGKTGGEKTPYREDSARLARSILDKFALSQDMKEGIVNLIRHQNDGHNSSMFYDYFRTPSQQKVAQIMWAGNDAARFKSSPNINIKGEPLRGLNDNLYTTRNSTIRHKYPKRAYMLKNGYKASVTVADLRNANFSDSASEYGWYNNKTLGETYVQVHNCNSAQDVENVIKSYLNPNKDMTLSTSIAKLNSANGNGYGNISLILSTGKGNNVVIATDAAGNMTGGKKGFDEFRIYARDKAQESNGSWGRQNEVLALNPKIESIALKNVAPENVPEDLVEIAAKYDIPILLLP